MKHIVRMALVALAIPAVNFALVNPAEAAAQETLSQSYRESRRDDVAYQKIEPIKAFDNLYYVAPGFVSVWLLVTSEGLILIDSAQEPYVDHVIDNIRKAGFDPKNIKYIMITHGHLDHFGGAARIQELSGARVMAVAEDWDLIEQAGSRPGRNGAPAPRVPKRDTVVKEGDFLTLGNTSLKLHQTPGHTPGVMSAEFTVFENGIPYKAFLHGGAGARDGLAGAQQAVATAARVANIVDIEVGVMVHSWMETNTYPNGSIFERAERLKNRKPGEENPFVDPRSWVRWRNAASINAAKTLAAEQAKAAAPK